jgi:hypothetical protein
VNPLHVARGRERMRALFEECDEVHGAAMSGSVRALLAVNRATHLEVWAFLGEMDEPTWREGVGMARLAAKCRCRHCAPGYQAIHGGAG